MEHSLFRSVIIKNNKPIMHDPTRFLKDYRNGRKFNLKILMIAEMEIIPQIIAENDGTDACLYGLKLTQRFDVDVIINNVYGMLRLRIDIHIGYIRFGRLPIQQ